MWAQSQGHSSFIHCSGHSKIPITSGHLHLQSLQGCQIFCLIPWLQPTDPRLQQGIWTGHHNVQDCRSGIRLGEIRPHGCQHCIGNPMKKRDGRKEKGQGRRVVMLDGHQGPP